MTFRFLAALALLSACEIVCMAAAPANDNFSGAALLSGTNVTVTATNVGATKEVGEPDHGSNSGGKSVWWKWTAPGAGSVIVQTVGSTFDTLLGAYRGASLGSLETLASNDDNGTVKTSLVGLNVTAGATYYFAVDGYNGDSGSITLGLNYRTTTLVRPANDNFANRIPLSGPTVNVTGANYLASKEKGEPNHVDELGGASVWWSWTAPAAGNVVIKTEGSNFDTILAVYTGSALTNLVAVAGNDDIDANHPTSLVTFNANARTVYQIAVDGYDGEPGDVQLHIAMQDVVWFQMPQLQPNGSVKLTATGTVGKQLAIEASGDLVKWDRIATVPNVTGAVEYTDSPPANTLRRYYRAQQLP